MGLKLKRERATSENQEYVYRGIHGLHPALSAARNRIVYAAKPDATLSPGVHHSGTYSGESQFTSWTFDYDVALYFARSKVPPGPVGIVLRLPMTVPGPGDEWYWVKSPGAGPVEFEVLLVGRRMDAEVVYDGSKDDGPSAA